MTNAKLTMDFALLILLATAEFVSTEVEVARLRWNGVGFYIVVDAATVQARLDTYAQASPGGKYSPVLVFIFGGSSGRVNGNLITGCSFTHDNVFTNTVLRLGYHDSNVNEC